MFCKNPYQPAMSFNLFPCGQCSICRVKRRNEWTTRLILESLTSPNPLFITLTYNDENLKDLNKRDLQLFFKRLRKSIAPRKVRYFACGEYGELYGRPHYHAVVYGDVTAPEIYQAWQQGIVYVGKAEPASMRYVAGYVIKKQALPHRPKEFILSSRRPGISYEALKFFLKYRSENGDVLDYFMYQGKKWRFSSYCVKKMREMVFEEDFIKQLKQDYMDSNLLKNLTISYLREKNIYSALSNLKKNVILFHQPSNEAFEAKQKLYRKVGKIDVEQLSNRVQSNRVKKF